MPLLSRVTGEEVHLVEGFGLWYARRSKRVTVEGAFEAHDGWILRAKQADISQLSLFQRRSAKRG